MKTTLLVRPAARGGKYLGADAADGGQNSAIVVLWAENQQIVAYGATKAPNAESAGPPNLLNPVSRNQPFAADNSTVGIELSVDIDAPTVYRLLVYGPLSHIDQARTAEAEITVLPGVDIGTTSANPEGIVLEIPGLCISGVQAELDGAEITCSAKVTMMCGCPIRADDNWYWPQKDFTVQLVTLTKSGDQFIYPLIFNTDPAVESSFIGQWINQARSGDPIVKGWLQAFQPSLGNQGMFRIRPALPAAQLPERLKIALNQP